MYPSLRTIQQTSPLYNWVIITWLFQSVILEGWHVPVVRSDQTFFFPPLWREKNFTSQFHNLAKNLPWWSLLFYLCTWCFWKFWSQQCARWMSHMDLVTAFQICKESLWLSDMHRSMQSKTEVWFCVGLRIFSLPMLFTRHEKNSLSLASHLSQASLA